jgi:hypothetical protein
MNHRIASAFAFTGTAALATLAAALMAGNAYAEGPILQDKPFVSSRTIAEVRAEVMRDRHLISSAGGEFQGQAVQPQAMASGYTREQARADFIASREEVRAMTSENGGSSHYAFKPARNAGTVLAGPTR